MSKPRIKIPDTSLHPDAGLVLKPDGWYAGYTEGSVRRLRKMTTRNASPTTARKARDLFYADLVAAGATSIGRKAGAKPVDAVERLRRATDDPFKYISRKPPYVVKIDNRVYGRFAGIMEARHCRNEALRNMAKGKGTA